MFWTIHLNFLLSKVIICNNLPVKKEIVAYGPFLNIDKVVPIPAFSVQYLYYNAVPMPERVDQFIKSKRHIILCYIVMRNGFFIETTVEFLKMCDPTTGVILSGVGTPEDDAVRGYLEELMALESKGTVLIINDMDHDTFMSLLNKCALYLRTPISDGVASSVLEALSQKIPVVASKNGRRPASVIQYEPDDANDMLEKVRYVLHNDEQVKQSIEIPDIEDTLQKEMELLKTFLS